MTSFAWVIGRTGLLGGAIAHVIEQREGWVLVPLPSLPWAEPERLRAEASDAADRVIRESIANGGRWSVIWAGGAAVTSTTQDRLDAELLQFEEVLSAIAERALAHRAARLGTVFYSSSAGGVYGGSEDPPFDEFTAPVPLSDYGRFKLRAENRLLRFSEESGVSVVSGRIANLYGPGQKLEKMQGLISHLAKAQFSPTPAAIFVPLETIRDYIFVSDCADLILDLLSRLASESEQRGRLEVTKILASGVAVSISQLLGHFRMLAKGHPHVRLGSSPDASLQGLDLRLTSRVWPQLDRRDITPLPAGIRLTMDDMLAQIQSSAP